MKTKLFITGVAITLGLAGCSNLLAGMAGNTGPAYRPSPCGTTTTAEANGLTLAFERAYRAQDGKLIVVIRLANYTQGWIERQFDIAGNLARMTSERGLFSGSGFEALDGDSAGSRSGELGPGRILRGQISFDAPIAPYFLGVHLRQSSPGGAFGCTLPPM